MNLYRAKKLMKEEGCILKLQGHFYFYDKGDFWRYRHTKEIKTRVFLYRREYTLEPLVNAWEFAEYKNKFRRFLKLYLIPLTIMAFIILYIFNDS